MAWFFFFLVLLAGAGYGIWRLRGSGRLGYGPPELYVVFPEKSRATRQPTDSDFIRQLQLPESSDGLQPRRAVPEVPAAPAVVQHQSGPSAQDAVDVHVASANGYADPTLQLLPGRLEIVNGMSGDAIRFIKQPGQTQHVTMGRAKGEPRAHVQIPSPTVSRMHVRMKFERGTWTIENLSETNPVSINGRGATGRGAQCVLADGDRIEMGEVAFVFRKR